MSFDHKAFLLDERRFRAELAPALERALAGDRGPIVAFLDAHAGELRDPYDGEPVGDGFREAIAEADADALGDLALTCFYDPSDDLGLGPAWPAIEARLADAGLDPAAFLGERFGAADARFDPGQMGSFFQSEADVARNLRALRAVLGARDDLDEALADLEELLATAADEGAGLYVTS
jgi:hypothetical protein